MKPSYAQLYTLDADAGFDERLQRLLSAERGGFLSGLSFSHSVALNDRSENPKSKATIDGLHTAARLLKTWSNARAAPTAARCVCTGVGHGTHLGTNNNKYESAMHRLDRDRAVAHACWSSD